MKAVNYFSAIWFSLGLVMTTASQLRFPGMPIGIGEVMLCIWLLITSISLIKSERVIVHAATKKFVAFWFSFFFLLLLGTFAGLYFGSWSESLYHDALAFLFSGILVIVCLLNRGFKEQIDTIIPFILIFTIVPLSALLIYGQVSPSLGPIQIWFDEVRFTGWSSNPNQLAFSVSTIPFLAAYKYSKSKGYLFKTTYILIAASSVWIGLATASDSLQAAWIVGGILLALLFWYRALSITKTSYWKGLITKIILPLTVVSILFIFGKPIQTEINDNVESILGADDQGDFRLILWKNGIEATALSPFFGHGPGPHSGNNEPFQEYEAHNTFIDLSTSAGILGLFLYLTFIFWAAWKAWSSGQNTILIGLISIQMFSTFHLVLRYPLFWFYMVIIFLISWNKFEKEGG